MWLFQKSGGKPRKKAPENILKGNEFYTIRLPDGTKDRSVEEALGVLETRYANVFRNKVRNHLPLNAEEHVDMCAFTFAMLYRTLRTRNNLVGFMDRVLKHVSELEAHHGVKSKTGDELRELRGNFHSQSLMQLLPKMTEMMANMSICFLCAPKIGPRFITSDNPAFMFNPVLQWHDRGSSGLGQENVEVYLPLSPTILLLFSWSNVKGYVHASSMQVRGMNRMIRTSSNEQFISHSPKKDLIWFSPIPLSFSFLMKFAWKFTIEGKDRILNALNING